MRSRSPVVELLLGAGALTVCLCLALGRLVVPLGLWAKSRSQQFLAAPASLRIDGVPERSVLLDAAGHPLAYFYEQNRSSVATRAMAPAVRAAIVAVEDAGFWTNSGVDVPALLRASLHNVLTGGHEGASTITQQYVKNLLVLDASTQYQQREATALTATRKLEEARYALALTRETSKADILTGYLNLVYFGSGAYGVQAAAETFFSTSAGQLSLPDAALLAGLVNSPAAFDPFTHPGAALARRSVVLDRMVQTGSITRTQADAAAGAPLGLHPGPMSSGCATSWAGYFCDWVQRQLLDDPALGATAQQRQSRLDSGGLVVRTTLDPRVQDSVQRAVDRTARSRAATASVVVQPGTGRVLAMAASVPFGIGPGHSSVNLPLGGATGFQAGSTFKVFVLTAALEQGIPLSLHLYAPQQYASKLFAPYNIVNGQPTPYTVTNAADSEQGDFTLEQATWHSVNTYYLQLEERTGFVTPAAIAESMGVRRADGRPLERVPSFTLGTQEVSPLAMAGAMATYAAHGLYCPTTGLLDVQGVAAHTAPRCRQVMDPRVADTVTRVLQGVISQGTGLNAKVPGDAAGKTGTVENYSAAWFVGYTPRYAAAVWMGDPRGGFAHPLTQLRIGSTLFAQVYGGDLPAQIWAALIANAPGGLSGASFTLLAPLPSVPSTAASAAGPGGQQPNPLPPPHHHGRG